MVHEGYGIHVFSIFPYFHTSMGNHPARSDQDIKKVREKIRGILKDTPHFSIAIL